MPEAEKVMGVSTDDIEKIMGVSKDDIEKVMGVEIPAGTITWAGVTGLQFGGNHYYTSGAVTFGAQIQYNTIGSTSNAQDFGDIASGGREDSGGAMTGNSAARAVIDGGSKSGARFNTDTDYITVASTGDTSDFGDKTIATVTGAAMSNGTLGFQSGGEESGGNYTAYMAYRNIASAGDFADAGDMKARREIMSVSGDSRGAAGGGSVALGLEADIYNEIEYTTFHTTNNASDFGDMINKGWGSCAMESKTRWILNNGYYYINGGSSIYRRNQDYVTAASTGNASDFGDDVLAYEQNGTSNGTRGEIWGGYVDQAYIDGTNYNNSGREEIRYVTIASTGDSQDTGALMLNDYEDWGGTPDRIVGALLGNAGGSGT